MLLVAKVDGNEIEIMHATKEDIIEVLEILKNKGYRVGYTINSNDYHSVIISGAGGLPTYEMTSYDITKLYKRIAKRFPMTIAIDVLGFRGNDTYDVR